MVVSVEQKKPTLIRSFMVANYTAIRKYTKLSAGKGNIIISRVPHEMRQNASHYDGVTGDHDITECVS